MAAEHRCHWCLHYIMVRSYFINHILRWIPDRSILRATAMNYDAPENAVNVVSLWAIAGTYKPLKFMEISSEICPKKLLIFKQHSMKAWCVAKINRFWWGAGWLFVEPSSPLTLTCEHFWRFPQPDGFSVPLFMKSQNNRLGLFNFRPSNIVIMWKIHWPREN